jgi:hypothetical protein
VRRRVLLLVTAIALALAAAPCAGQPVESVFTFAGYDYAMPVPGSTHYLDVGDGWRSVGYVTSVNPNMLGPYLDFLANEYTCFIDNLTVKTTYSDGTYVEADFGSQANGRMTLFEDPIRGGTHGAFGVNPPNATVPSTFTDGVEILGGNVWWLFIDYDSRTGQGDIEGYMDLDEGSDLARVPEVERTRLTLYSSSGGGLLGPPNATIPQGYDHQVSGIWFDKLVVPVTHRTWGAVKALYR